MNSLESAVRPTSLAKHGRLRAALAFTVVGVTAAVLALLRLSDTARGTVWAEDGALFLYRAAHPELLSSWILTPYDGYTHALSQLIAIVVWAVVPIAQMGLAVTFAACAVSGAVAAGAFAFTRRWHLSVTGRLLLAATTVLIPDLTFEVLGNLANLHWFLLWLTPFVLLTRPRTWAGATGMAALLFVIGTSEIQSLVFAPLLLWHVRDRRRLPLFGGLVAAGVVQSLALLGGSRDRGTSASIASLVDGYFLQVPLTALVGTGQRASVVVAHAGWLVAYASAIPFAVCGVWFAWRSRHRIALALLFAAASAVLWAIGFAVNYSDAWHFSEMDAATLAAGIPQLRYAIVPTMFLFGLVALAVGGDRRSRSRGRPSPAALAVLLVATGLFVVWFQVPDGAPRSSGPAWSDAVSVAADSCRDSGAAEAAVPIAPSGWAVAIPCGRLVE